MKNAFNFIFFFLIILIYAQKKEGKITYKNLISKQEQSLYFNKNRSLFTFDGLKQETSVKKMSDGSIVYPSNTIDSIANKTKFIYFDNQKKIFYNNTINDDVETVIYDNLRVNWILKKEKKKILHYICQKAEGEYYGKKYIAWFTRQLPYNYGPLKINGLDGLILEVSAEDNSLHLIAGDILYGNFENVINNLITRYDFRKSVSREDYNLILDKQFIKFEKEITDYFPKNKEIKLKKDCSDCNKK